MKVKILEVKSRRKIDASIEKARATDMPIKKNGWQFTWRTLYKTEGAEFYKLSLIKDSSTIEGIIMLSVMYDEMLYMNNIEIAPHNLGSDGQYDYVAGCLIAYGCLKSFELGKSTYTGYLTFESKTALIPLYQRKYGATLAMGQRMFIAPEIGLELIEKYLK